MAALSLHTVATAIATAASYCSISGRGTSWTVYGPHRASEPNGASSATNCDSYIKAVRVRTAARAYIALHLLGRLDDDTRFAVMRIMDDPYALCGHSLRGVVRAVLSEGAGNAAV